MILKSKILTYNRQKLNQRKKVEALLIPKNQVDFIHITVGYFQESMNRYNSWDIYSDMDKDFYFDLVSYVLNNLKQTIGWKWLSKPMQEFMVAELESIQFKILEA